MQSAKAEQDDQADATDEAKELDEGVERIIINDNDSRWERIDKAEQWCKQALKITETDFTWSIRLGDTYAAMSNYACASENYKKVREPLTLVERPHSNRKQQAARSLQAQDPVNKEQLRDVFKTLAEWATDRESALEYLADASKLDEGNVEILHAMLQQYVSTKKPDEARSIIQKFSTEKVAHTESTLLMGLLKTAVSKREQGYLSSVFKTIFPLLSSHPELWADFQYETEVVIETARTEGKDDELAVLLLLQGSAGCYLHRHSPGKLVDAAGCLRECLDTIPVKDASDDQDRLDFIKQIATIRLSMCYLEIALQARAEEQEGYVEKLRQIHEDDPAAKVPKAALASLYSSTGQRDKARDIFRVEMVEAFNILVDDDILNDFHGFTILRSLLSHVGDDENARRAASLLPELQFDETVLKELLAGESPYLQAASAELVQFYQRECPDKRQHWENLTKVWGEAERLESEAAVGGEVAACYRMIGTIFAKQEARAFWGVGCSNCVRRWDYYNGLHCCKYCEHDLCDVCWEDLRSGELDQAFVCGTTHDWYYVAPLTNEQYLRAFKGLVSMKTADGGEELISTSKWLGTLCEDWGMSKTDWNFE